MRSIHNQLFLLYVNGECWIIIEEIIWKSVLTTDNPQVDGCIIIHLPLGSRTHKIDIIGNRKINVKIKGNHPIDNVILTCCRVLSVRNLSWFLVLPQLHNHYHYPRFHEIWQCTSPMLIILFRDITQSLRGGMSGRQICGGGCTNVGRLTFHGMWVLSAIFIFMTKAHLYENKTKIEYKKCNFLFPAIMWFQPTVGFLTTTKLDDVFLLEWTCHNCNLIEDDIVCQRASFLGNPIWFDFLIF